MPETSLPPSLGEAAMNVEARLAELTGQIPEWLDARAIADAYPRRDFFTGGWRVGVRFTDGVVRRFDTVLTTGFPSVPVRTALVDHPPPMTWPHVEGDGVLCLLPNMAECDPDDPPAVAENLFGRSVRLVEESSRRHHRRTRFPGGVPNVLGLSAPCGWESPIQFAEATTAVPRCSSLAR